MNRRRWAILSVYAGMFLAFCLVLLGFVAVALLGLRGPPGVGHLLLGVGLTTSILVSLSLLYVGVGRAQVGWSGALRRLRLVAPDPLSALVAILGVLGTSFCVDGLIQLLGLSEVGTLAELRTQLEALDGWAKLGAALVIGFGPGLGEELFFRGYVLRRLAVAAGPVHALVASALVFGLFHLDPVQSPAAAVLGLYLGLAVLISGSLWVGILAHAANNAAATLFTMLEVGEPQASILMFTGLVVAISSLFVLVQRHPRIQASRG